jgi:FMN phosphatase YigB (HAD superfamily)
MGERALLWDMAGTLIPYDPQTGRPGVLPGCDEYLPEIARDFRMYVTTGDTCGGARSLLHDFELLDHFEEVYCDLLAPLGKPYGAILEAVGADAPRSLAVGDRLRADVAADTDQVVTVLINQDARICNCGMVSYLIRRLRARADSFPVAFDALLAEAAPDPEAEGPAQGGEIVTARRGRDGLDLRLWIFRHDLLDGDRRVVVL